MPYIVTELLAGAELRAQLSDGALPVRKALDYAQQIASGLAAAHEKGVVHRDLKPENLFVTQDGRVKILDFGLAKLKPQKLAGGVDAEAPTLKPLTDPGVVMGTVGYMAPEQVRGQEADHRSDIFNFGLILYEMLAGRRAFRGESFAETMAAIVKEEPAELAEVSVPAGLERVMRRCLEKRVEERFHSAHDLGFALEALATPSGSQLGAAALPLAPETQGKARGPRWLNSQWLGWAVAGVLLLGLLLGPVTWFQRAPVEVRAIRSFIPPPENSSLLGTGLAISPDGRQLAFVARTAQDNPLIRVRSLDALADRALPGTDGATHPFWSPDSRSLGFFAGGKLRRVEVAGGPPLILCDAPDGRGGTWNHDGVIVFASAMPDLLYRVSAAGGQASAIAKFAEGRAGSSYFFPSFLPDGQRFLYLSQRMIHVASLDSPAGKPLLQADSKAVYVQGYLLFARAGTLMAQPFDTRRLETAGDAFSVAEQVNVLTDGSAAFSVSEQGILAYQTGAFMSGSRLTWFDRNGKQTGVLGDSAIYRSINLSPDGKSVAVQISDLQNAQDLWLYEVTRGIRTPFTTDGNANRSAVWSPDGNRLVFNSRRKGEIDLYQRAADGTGEELLFASDLEETPSSWSLDGRFLLFHTYGDPKTKADVWVLPLEGARKPLPLLQTEFTERRGQFSPDGRWIVYTSDESGREEVYVAAFPGPGGKRRVSTAGGIFPRWRGKEIFYLTTDNKLMAAEVNAQGTALKVGAVRALFEFRPASVTAAYPYDVTTDGQRFLINPAVEQSASAPITLVQNWTAGVKK
jgi:Tol biopolymer transport system component